MMTSLFALIVWFGQIAGAPAFEVASIKEARPPSTIENIQAAQFHIGISIDGSRADYGFMSLADLIPYAYRVQPYQLSGPSWMNETRWDILARIPEGQLVGRTPEMMQNLLAERFKLSMHRQNREQSVYALVVGKSGPKFGKATVGEEIAGGRLNVVVTRDGVAMSGGAAGAVRMAPSPNGGIQMQVAKITMAALADRLTQFMDRPVVDATDLKGDYQVSLDLPREAMNGMGFAQKLAVLAGLGSFGMAGGSPETNARNGSAIIEAVKALGLELQSRRAVVETIIVDRVEKTPTAN